MNVEEEIPSLVQADNNEDSQNMEGSFQIIDDNNSQEMTDSQDAIPVTILTGNILLTKIVRNYYVKSLYKYLQ